MWFLHARTYTNPSMFKKCLLNFPFASFVTKAAQFLFLTGKIFTRPSRFRSCRIMTHLETSRSLSLWASPRK